METSLSHASLEITPRPRRQRVARCLFALAVVVLVLSPTETGGVVRSALEAAYLQVSVFVAATLALFYFLEKRLDIDMAGVISSHERLQVPIAAFFGALPGCGGAVIVVTQFVHRRISFGAFVAVLVATMGDAAFLLLAQKPALALMIFVVGWVAGTVSGYTVDAIHGPGFMHGKPEPRPSAAGSGPIPMVPASLGAAVAIDDAPVPKFHKTWLYLAVPGVVLGGLLAFRPSVGETFGPLFAAIMLGIGIAGALLSLAIWVQRGGESLQNQTFTDHHGCHRLAPMSRVVTDTAFVTAWVIVAYLAFELTVHFTQFDLEGFFTASAPLIPLLAAVIGLLPGCGPQVITTTLYLNGFVPLSAQVANALSNDGDALFPALALTPRAAILATVYTTVPALMVGYTYYFLFE